MMAVAAQREEVRDAILDATDRLLARYGYAKMTMDDLAREVGIGKGTIYLHFESKEDVALSHIDRIVERVKDELRRIAASRESVADRLRGMLAARVLIRFDSVQHYTESLNDVLAAIRPALLARRRRYFDEEAEIFAGVLAEARKQREIVCDDPLATAHTLLIATNSLLPYSLSRTDLGLRRELEKRVLSIADLLLHGLMRVKRR